MLADSALAIPCATRPGSFAALMTLYESNYVRLSWLLPLQSDLPQAMVSRVPEDLPLYMNLVEATRYTTTFCLTYYFDEGENRVADPDLIVRVYHDARLAEAMGCTRTHRHVALRAFETAPGVELSRRWARNVMLNKWLEYCSDMGHRFHTVNTSEDLIVNP